MQGTQRAGAPSRTAARKGACMAAPDSDQQVADRIARAVRAAAGRPRPDRSPAAARVRGGRGHPRGAGAGGARAGAGGRRGAPRAGRGAGRVAGASWRRGRTRRSRWPWAVAAVVLALAGLATALVLTQTAPRSRCGRVVKAAPPAVTVPAVSTETTATPPPVGCRAPAGAAGTPSEGARGGRPAPSASARDRAGHRGGADVPVRRGRRRVAASSTATSRAPGPSAPASCGLNVGLASTRVVRERQARRARGQPDGRADLAASAAPTCRWARAPAPERASSAYPPSAGR